MKTVIGGYGDIPFAADLIKGGEIVAFPTETVYGLGASAFCGEAIKKIFAAKGRPQDNPLIVHIADISMLEQVASEVPAIAYTLFKEFSPGPLTLILKKNPAISPLVTAGLNTVGVRIPAHRMALELIKAAELPICAPSANTSSRVSPTMASHVYEDMAGRIPLILDGGSCEVGVESTVLDLTSEPYAILRPGRITAGMLAPFIKVQSTPAGQGEGVKSPGMKYRHYAPLVKTLLADTPARAIALRNSYTEGRAVILGSSRFIEKCGEGISLGSTSGEIAQNLYAALRKAEKEYDCLIIEKLPESEENTALLNRILKAAD
ncbi:MAG: L-threonylcarbamoyladenylate synthase [Christensenellales bacterium]|jgi:L-threonylcarbamoyladenylate synthase